MRWKLKGFELRNRSDFIYLFLACLFLIYTFSYLSHGALPGNNTHIEGWWGWWDQSKYLQSAQAFSIQNLSAQEHWYPPGYALLAAPMQKFSAAHSFFFIDAIGLLIAAYFFIRICEFFTIGNVYAVVIFVLSTILSKAIFEQFVVPWTTTPTSALYYIIFFLFFSRQSDIRTWALIGLLSGLILLFRPTDVITTIPLFIYLILSKAWNYRNNNETLQSLSKTIAITFATGAVGPIVYLGIYLLIYGFNISEYLKLSQGIGFLFSSIPFKLYVLFVDPHSTYDQGKGILKQYPWIFISLVGMTIYATKNFKSLILVSCITLHVFFYASYLDLLPTGLWKYANIHYYKWVFPLLGMFAWLSLRDLIAIRNFRTQGAIAVTLLILLSIRLTPTAVTATAIKIEKGNQFDVSFEKPEKIQALDFPMAKIRSEEMILASHEIYADGRRVGHTSEYRAFLMPFGIRILFNKPMLIKRLNGSFIGEISLHVGAPQPVGR